MNAGVVARGVLLVPILFAACADAETRRTALDPSDAADRAVRELTTDVIAATEACDFERVSEIVGHEIVLDRVSDEDPSGLEPAYFALTHCAARIDYDDVDIGHAVFASYVDHPDAVRVSVSGRSHIIATESSAWEQFDQRYYFNRAADGSWRLISNWIGE